MLKTYDEFAMRKAALLDRLMALDGQRMRKQDDFREKLEEMGPLLLFRPSVETSWADRTAPFVDPTSG